MSRPLWHDDPIAWGRLDLPDQLDQLRSYYCTGPSGQALSVQRTRSVTEETLRKSAEHLRALYKEKEYGWKLLRW